MNGTRLAHYEITALVGKGGMGEVDRAQDTKLGRDVALKIRPAEFAQDRERLRRFRREARTLGSLNHAHIAAIHDIDEGGVRLGNPRKLFSSVSTRWSSEWESGFSVDPTGERFLVVRRRDTDDSQSPKIVVVENWEIEFAQD
jgi:serine/threonine protein kinase